MIEPKINYPETTIIKMNVPFTIKLAVTRNDATIDHIFETTTALIEKDLDEIDDKFSPFKTNSLISKFHRGDNEVFFQDAMFQSVYNQCAIAKVATNGYYNGFKNDRFDPNGILLGWAIETEFQKYLKPLLIDPSIVGVSLSSNEQMQLATKTDSVFAWSISVANPNDADDILAVYNIQNGAIATANVKTGTVGANFKQITILSKGLTEAAVLADAGLTAPTDVVEGWINRSRLTGMFIDEQDEMMSFNNGMHENIALAQM